MFSERLFTANTFCVKFSHHNLLAVASSLPAASVGYLIYCYQGGRTKVCYAFSAFSKNEFKARIVLRSHQGPLHSVRGGWELAAMMVNHGVAYDHLKSKPEQAR